MYMSIHMCIFCIYMCDNVNENYELHKDEEGEYKVEMFSEFQDQVC